MSASANDEPTLTVVYLSENNRQEVLKIDDLKAIDETSFETTTQWTTGGQKFTGVSLKAFVEHLGLTEGSFSAVAANDYAVEVPIADAVDGGPIIAFLQNDAPMHLRDKGPFWLVYPYDKSADYRTELVYSRSIWQLVRIELP